MVKKNEIENLYDIYPVLKEIDSENDEIIRKSIIFKTILTDEYLSAYGSNCPGFLFVIKGSIRIRRINEEGEETHLYNIGKGELCHEALSCYLKCEPLKIVGVAVQDSYIAIIPFDIVNSYLLKDSKFLKYTYIDLHNKFNKIINNKEEKKHEAIETRLVKLLLNNKSKIIYTTHNEIAFELDSAREVISRKLKELENKGYIKGSRGKIQVLKDLNELLI